MNMSFSAKILLTSLLLSIVLLLSSIIAISAGSSGTHFLETLSVLTGNSDPDSVTATIIWQIRLPRVILAAFVGGTLALGGLVFQALLRNPLAEPPAHAGQGHRPARPIGPKSTALGRQDRGRQNDGQRPTRSDGNSGRQGHTRLLDAGVGARDTGGMPR